MTLEANKEQGNNTETNGNQAGNKAIPKAKNQETNTVKRVKELTPIFAGEKIGSGEFSYRSSSTTTMWKNLRTGDTFSRSADGKVVYMRTSKTTAYPLDKGLDVMHIPTDSQSLEVFRVWINTF